MKPYLSFGALGQIRDIGTINPKSWHVIQNGKLLISHQMKPLKTIYWLSYTCFNIFGELEQVREIGPKYIPQIMGTDTQKVIHSVKLHNSHQMNPYSSLKAIWVSIYTCSYVLAKLGQVGEIWHKYTKSRAEIHRKSSKVLNSTLHIKWSLTQW